MSKILIVDDNTQNIFLLKTILSGHGYVVLSAGNGVEALEAARKDKPDIIISDILMPTMDGFTLCREWKKDEHLHMIPFIFYTATYTDERDRDFGLNLGAARFLVKPTEPEKLIVIIKQVIEESQSGNLITRVEPVEDETVYYRMYNETLIRKLEKKMFELEKLSRELEQDIAERKQAEEALSRSEVLLSRAQRIARLGHWEWDVPGKQLTWSDEIYRIFGVPGDHVLSFEGIVALIHPEDRRRNKAFMEKLLAGAEQAELEFRIISPDGQVKHVHQYAEVNRDYSGTVDTIIGTMQDVSTLKRAEEELRRSENKYRTLFESMAQGVVYQDRDGTITSANSAATEILGLTMEQMQGRNSHDPRWKAVHEDGSEFPGDSHPSMIALRTGRQVENVLMGIFNPKIEKYRWILINAVPQFREGESAPFQVYTTLTDITERRLAEEQLRYQAKLLKNVSDAVISTDNDFRIVSWNRAAERLYGWRADEVIGKSFGDIVPTEYINAKSADVLTEFSETRSWQGEVIQENKAGNSFYVFASVTALLDQEGNSQGAIAVNRDITERKHAEELIHRSLKEKEALIKELHHRVKNNLQFITSMIALQEKYFLNDKDRELLKDTQSRIHSIALVHEMLYKNENFAMIDFSNHLIKLIEELSVMYGVFQEKIDISLEAADIFLDINIAVPCSQIITELVTNSMKHAFPDRRKGKITIDVKKDADKDLILRVRDNGIGFPENFEFPGNESLGLTLVTVLVKQIKGTLEVIRTGGVEYIIKFRTGDKLNIITGKEPL